MASSSGQEVMREEENVMYEGRLGVGGYGEIHKVRPGVLC
jgi:hypothetical protein